LVHQSIVTPINARAGGSVHVRVEHQVVGDVHGAVSGIGGATSELRHAPLDALEVTAAAAVLDVAGGVKAIAVPRSRRGVGEGAAVAFDVACDVEDAPGALVAAIERLDDVDGATVEIGRRPFALLVAPLSPT
jgi:hypothetical protein